MSKLQIIKVPHPTLRKKSVEIKLGETHSPSELRKLVLDLEDTLEKTTKPKGVGLAAPQIDQLWRVFTTKVEELFTMINPVIIDHSSDQTLGPDKKEPILEGCLSIPRIYGPVPRWQWVEMEYQALDGDKLVRKSKRFDDYNARVVQHELDHLDGVLFIDHSLRLDLPVYQEDADDKQAQVVEKSFLELL